MARKRLAGVSVEDLLAELQKRQRRLPRLQKRRARLAAALERLDREIASLSGSARPGKVRRSLPGKIKVRRTPRAKNKASLADALASVMKESGGPLTVKEAAEAVKKAGYKSNAANFRAIVTQTLTKDKRFKRVARGKYGLA
jgi:hypothetical protein